MRIGCSSSPATIIASVVLPSPGGPESSTWSGGVPRRLAAVSTRRAARARGPGRGSRRAAWVAGRPRPAARRCRLGRASTTRAVASKEPSAQRPARCRRPRPTVPRPRGRPLIGRAPAGRRAAAPTRSRPRRPWGRPGRARRRPGARSSPRPTSASRTCSRHDLARVERHRRRRRGRPGQRAELVLELEDEPLGALAPMPGTLVSATRSPRAQRDPHRVGRVHREHRERPAAGRRPRPSAPSRRRAFSSSVGEAVERQRVLAHDERGRELGGLAEPHRRSRSRASCGRACRRRRRPPRGCRGRP